MGGLKGAGPYYHQGSTFLIEYDNTQDANHIHCVWREFKEISKIFKRTLPNCPHHADSKPRPASGEAHSPAGIQ
jgi:hypothetical protein